MTSKVYKLRYSTIRQLFPPFLLLVAVIVMPRACASGVKEGLSLCAEILIPSIFPTLLATVLVVESGGAVWLGKKLRKISRLLFELPGEASGALLLALLGGYPAGAKAVVGLYQKGSVTKTQAQRMLLFCFCAGPAFLIGAVGSMAGSAWAGVILLAANFISVVIIGVFLGKVLDRDHSGEIAGALRFSEKTEKIPFSQALVVSVRKAAESMLSVCLYVIVFSVLRAMLQNVGLQSVLLHFGQRADLLNSLLTAFLEVSAGCVETIRYGLVLTGFFVGFGGLSVHAQVWAIAHECGINKGLFFILRILQGALTAGFTALGLLLAPAVESGASVQLSSMPTAGGSALLMLLCVALVGINFADSPFSA